jgi:2'-5' RNA ligase
LTDERTIRSFLALDPPERIREGIEAVQLSLKKIIRGDIRWARPEGIHLTLKFFGGVSEADVVNISAVVERLAGQSLPLALAIGGVGVFPDLRRPRVLWLGMHGEVERLIAFQQDLERSLQKVGFPREERPFRPHLTLGRIKAPARGGLVGLAEVLEKGESYTVGEFSASGLGLFKSDLTPQGAIYTRLAWYPFAGREGA